MCKTKGISVFWIPLSPKVSRLSPYTHAHSNIRELQEPYTHSHKLPLQGVRTVIAEIAVVADIGERSERAA